MGAFFLLLLLVLLFIGIAHYVTTRQLEPPREKEFDLGTEHPIRIHKLTPDGRGEFDDSADG